eukprot:gene12057-13300_t
MQDFFAASYEEYANVYAFDIDYILLCPLGLSFANAKHLTDEEICLRGEYFEDYALKGGTRAGDYINLGTVTTLDDCAALCCQRRRCKMALVVKTRCFQVDCYAGEPHKCKRISAKHSKFKPKLFIRGEVEKPMKFASPQSDLGFVKNSSLLNDTTLPELVRVKRRKASCHHYNGKVCKSHLDRSHFYYFTTQSPSEYDRKLAHVYAIAHKHLSTECKRYALFAICSTWYPRCLDAKHPKPTRLCRRSCEQLQDDWCQQEYDYDGDMARHARFKIYDVRLGSRTTAAIVKQDSAMTVAPRGESELRNSDKSDVPTTTATVASKRISPTIASVVSMTALHNDASAKHASTATTSSAILKPSEATSRERTSAEMQKKVSPRFNHFVLFSVCYYACPLVTVTADSDKETNLEEADNQKKGLQPTVATTAAKVQTKTELVAIQVSAGDNKVITLPENKVDLYASTWPKPPK